MVLLITGFQTSDIQNSKVVSFLNHPDFGTFILSWPYKPNIVLFAIEWKFIGGFKSMIIFLDTLAHM